MAFDCHIQGIIGQPVTISGLESGHILGVPVPTPFKGFFEQGKAGVIEGGVVHPQGVASPERGLAFSSGQKAILTEQLQVDKIGVARKGREGLIGRIP